MIQIPASAPKTFGPSEFIAWATALGLVFAGGRWLLIKLRNWGKDTANWNEAVASLKQLSKDVSELLYEIRGVNGSGGINERLARIETRVEHIEERNGDADVLVSIYKSELIERKRSGEPMRRDIDTLISKLTPGET